MYELSHLEPLGSTVRDTVGKLKPVEPFAFISKDSGMGSAMPTEGELMLFKKICFSLKLRREPVRLI